MTAIVRAPQAAMPWYMRALSVIAPRHVMQWLAVRHYEAASAGRRTEGWMRASGASLDPDSMDATAADRLAAVSWDLYRNDAWVRRGVTVLRTNVIGWGIDPHAPKDLAPLWKDWARRCDHNGRLTWAALQSQALVTMVLTGGCFSIKHVVRGELRIELVGLDRLDRGKGVSGVEVDEYGRATGYWIKSVQRTGAGMAVHPKEFSTLLPVSRCVLMYEPTTPGQLTSVSRLAPIILRLKDLNEYEDASLVRHKIAACFAAFVTDMDGTAGHVGISDADAALEQFEPGMIKQLRPGQNIEFGTPPTTEGIGDYVAQNLRAIAAGFGVTYEDLTQDYSNVNFSSARMSRLSHWAGVRDLRWNTVVPMFCEPIWAWWAELQSIRRAAPAAVDWTAPPMPMLEPDREGKAYRTLVRAGAMTPSEMVRERGLDPDTHWQEYEDDLAELDRRGIWLDCDVRKTSDAGFAQPDESPANGAGDGGVLGGEE